MPHLKLRRHYKLLLLLALVVAVLIAGAGDRRIVAYSAQDAGQVAGVVSTYGGTLAALVDLVPGSTPIPGAVQASSAANVQ